MRIVIDAMGGDNAPGAVCEAAAKCSRIPDVELVLVGREAEVRAELDGYGTFDNISIKNADEIITNNEEPVKAIKTKKNSSLVVAAEMLSKGDGDALVSCGSTGAILTAALLIVGRIKGIKRPALATLLPSEKGPVILMDSGANTGCKPENLVQFAIMGNIYMRDYIDIKSPRVGLISNGEEEGKGNALVKETYPLLKDADLNFIGNIEGRDVMYGKADVIVCDGFVGNVILKSIEGMAAVFGNALKKIFLKNIFTKLGALLTKKGITEFKKTMDYREYGGAPFLGVKKPVIKGHGSSDAKAVTAAINQAIVFTRKNYEATLIKELAKTEKGENDDE
ncbi:MAG: phosphate acyltransferase PlsX [Eubacteriales bacterium]|nr:phosphate acyltransferase PlsX [Eubacteriales bacterium]